MLCQNYKIKAKDLDQKCSLLSKWKDSISLMLVPVSKTVFFKNSSSCRETSKYCQQESDGKISISAASHGIKKSYFYPAPQIVIRVSSVLACIQVLKKQWYLCLALRPNKQRGAVREIIPILQTENSRLESWNSFTWGQMSCEQTWI